MDQVAYPKKLTIALTDRCNLKCFICWRDEFEASIDGKGRHIAIDNIRHMETAIRHAEAISITGFGESFLFPQLHEVLDYIFSLNPRDNLIMAISNGTALSYEHGRKIGSRLRELVVSLNAANPAAYQRDMHPDANRLDYKGKADPRVRLESLNGAGMSQFERTCNRVREFMRGLPPEDRKKVRLHYVVHRDNIEDMDEFVLVAKELGCSTVGFYHYMVTQESRIDYSLYFHQARYNDSFDRASRLGRALGVQVEGATFGTQSPATFDKERDCTSPFDEAIVYTTGEVAPCCHSGGEMMGNAFHAGFDGVWFGHKYRMLREERFLDGCQTCNQYRTLDDVDLHFHPHVKTSEPYKRLFSSLAAERKASPLKLLVVGAGADGNRSLWKMISALLEINGAKASVHHDAGSYTSANAVMEYVTRGDDTAARKLLASWRHDIVVSDNLAFLMPVVREMFGPDIKIIHLKRSRTAAIAALTTRARLFPQYWGGYVPLDLPHDIIRPTALHFRELSRSDWNALELAGQIAWLYDKTHALIEAGMETSSNFLQIATETLNDPAAIARVASFIDPSWTGSPQPVHLNAGRLFDLTAIEDPYERIRVERILSDFDINQVLSSESYAIDFFTSALTKDVIGRLRSAKNNAALLRKLAERVRSWVDTARGGRIPQLTVAGPGVRKRRIRMPHLTPAQQIHLEDLLGKFEAAQFALDGAYGLLYFLECQMAPLQGKASFAPDLVEILEPMAQSLYEEAARLSGGLAEDFRPAGTDDEGIEKVENAQTAA